MHPHSVERGRESENAHITGRETMAPYILLASFTDQGIRKINGWDAFNGEVPTIPVT
jgi:hypothetical protein